MKNIFNLALDILIYSRNQTLELSELIDVRIENLFISSVEYTGVGLYINFCKPTKVLPKFINFGYIGAEGRIEFDNNGILFDFIISYKDGYIDIIEIVTPENINWNGNFLSYVIKS